MIGSLAVRFLIGDAGGLGVTHPFLGVGEGVVLEGLLTFILKFVIMAVATDTRAVGQAAAIAIDRTIALKALFAGAVTGASMNSARSLGLRLVAGDFVNMGLYLAAPIVGAALGALTYRIVSSPADRDRAGNETNE